MRHRKRHDLGMTAQVVYAANDEECGAHLTMSRHRRRSGNKLLGYEARGKSKQSDWLGAGAPVRREQEKSATRSDTERGPTEAQQQILADVCRRLGVECPSPKTAVEASEQIRNLCTQFHAKVDHA